VWRVSEELLRYFREDGGVYVSGQLRVVAEAVNPGSTKTTRVGLRYTVDDWATWKDIDGTWSIHRAKLNTDQFVICSESTIPPGTLVRYAIYFLTSGSSHWDHNQSRDYSAQF
jgi:hypothetical protein